MRLHTVIFVTHLLVATALSGCSSKVKQTENNVSQNVVAVSNVLWEDVDYRNIKAAGKQVALPKVFRTMKLNTALMREKLNSLLVSKSEIIEIPLPQGGFVKYKFTEANTLAPELLQKFPQLRTYSGQGIDEPTSTAKFDFMETGFHGYLFTLKGSVIIDPFSTADTLHYICYYKQDTNEQKQPFEKPGDTLR